MKFKDFFVCESSEHIVIPTKILGYQDDLIISKIDNTIEIFEKNGDFVELKDGTIFNKLLKIFKDSKKIKYKDYLREFDHKKFYNKNDWDSNEVVIEVKGNLDTKQLLKLI